MEYTGLEDDEHDNDDDDDNESDDWGVSSSSLQGY